MQLETEKKREDYKTPLALLLAVILALIMVSAPARAADDQPQIREQGGQSVEELKKTAPKVYIDCGYCDLDYIKTEIPFVNYVRERKEADVHVLITTLATGSGGDEYTLTFIGQNRFQGQDDVFRYFSHKTDTEEEIRAGLTGVLKIGLMAYVNRTPIRDKIKVDFQKEEAAQGPAVDRWKSWVFSLSSSGYFSGEQAHASESVRGSFSANRVTKNMKFNFTASASYQHDRYTYEDQNLESNTRSLSGSGGFSMSISY